MNKKDEKITKELDKDRIISLKYEVAKLKEEYLELDKQCAVERETANGLDYTCENYEKQIKQLKSTLDEINALTFHAGCQNSPKCVWCKIQRLAKHEGKSKIQLNDDSMYSPLSKHEDKK